MKHFTFLLVMAAAVCGMMSDALADDFGVLQLTTEPSEVTVYVDGTKKGTSTPISLKLKEGDHTVTIERSGYGTKKFDIFVGADAMLKKEVKLDKEGTLTNSIGMSFVKIPSGSFMMGSPSSEPGRLNDRETQHKVSISRSFYMQTTEVTQGQWKAIMGGNPSYFKDCGDNCPVEMVSWDDTQVFIRKLNEKEGTNKYRLPAEAEWEYAARAGTTTPFAFGNCLSTSQANYNGNNLLEGCSKGTWREKTVSVGSFSPNVWGLYDMHGNVNEWCQDWYDKDYPSGSVTDPIGPSSGSGRVFRGGNWNYSAQSCRSASRDDNSPTNRNGGLGFRLVRSE